MSEKISGGLLRSETSVDHYEYRQIGTRSVYLLASNQVHASTRSLGMRFSPACKRLFRFGFRCNVGRKAFGAKDLFLQRFIAHGIQEVVGSIPTSSTAVA